MAVIKHTTENMFRQPLTITSDSTATHYYAADSTSDGGQLDVFIGGKTACATT